MASGRKSGVLMSIGARLRMSILTVKGSEIDTYKNEDYLPLDGP
jgi:hypothetical protein